MAESLAAGARTKREQQRLETRELLYQLAVDEFRRVGAERARIRDIVRAAGVVPGTFYFHFPSKDHVLYELSLRSCRRLVERLPGPGRAGPASLASFLRGLGEAMLGVEQELDDPRLARDSLTIHLRPPSDVDPASNPVLEALVAFFARAIARGEVRSRLGAEELAHIVLTSLLGTFLVAAESPAARRAEVRRTVEFFVEALRRRRALGSRGGA